MGFAFILLDVVAAAGLWLLAGYSDDHMFAALEAHRCLCRRRHGSGAGRRPLARVALGHVGALRGHRRGLSCR